jgi:CheY-like chemotaxis protein
MSPIALIVDDSLTVRMDLKEAFESAGFTVTLCATAVEARQALALHVCSVLVLDVILPDTDGLELLAEVRSDPRVSVHGVSAYAPWRTV